MDFFACLDSFHVFLPNFLQDSWFAPSDDVDFSQFFFPNFAKCCLLFQKQKAQSLNCKDTFARRSLQFRQFPVYFEVSKVTPCSSNIFALSLALTGGFYSSQFQCENFILEEHDEHYVTAEGYRNHFGPTFVNFWAINFLNERKQVYNSTKPFRVILANIYIQVMISHHSNMYNDCHVTT